MCALLVVSLTERWQQPVDCPTVLPSRSDYGLVRASYSLAATGCYAACRNMCILQTSPNKICNCQLPEVGSARGRCYCSTQHANL